MAEVKQDNTGKYVPKPLVGLSSLSKEERDAFISKQMDLKKLPRMYTMEQADRLYRNKQFIDKFGIDKFKEVTNKNSENYLSPELRDEAFNRDEFRKGIDSRFANDPNLEYYQHLTTEGMRDLLDSGILSSDEMQEEVEKLEKNRASNPENKRKNRFLSMWRSGVASANESILGSLGTSTDIGLGDAIAYDRKLLNEEEKKQVETARENERQKEFQKIADFTEGVVSSGLSDEDTDNAIKRLKESNIKRQEDFKERENTRIINLPEIQEGIKINKQSLYDDINRGVLSIEDAEKAFTDAYDNDGKDQPSGSRYYTAYKDKSELSHIDLDYKLEKLAELYTLSLALNNGATAMSVIDTDFFNDAKAHQGWWKRRINTISGAGTKAAGMTANWVLSPVADVYHSLHDKDADEYRRYKTAEDALNTKAGYLLNPNYWNYVDQYVTFSPSEIQRINHNGGVSGNVNLYNPTGKMTAEQFIAESFKMVGYMIPAAALTLATKKVPRTSFWAKAISGAEITGSAFALGSAYSSGAYSKLLLDTQTALDAAFDKESKNYIEDYYNKHEGDIETYLKKEGITEETNPLIAFPYYQAAQRALYQDAKAAYFNDNPDRATAYEDAEKVALQRAKLGATVDDFVETGRMLISGAFWGKWTKSKLTRDLRNRSMSPVAIEKTAEGTHKARQAASRNSLGAKEALMAVTAGGVDNFLDDVTVGIGEGLGMGFYNNYIGTTYNPNNTVEGMRVASGMLDSMYYGMQGADKALHDPQTWIDGAIGAAGTFMGTRINAITLLGDLIKREGIFSKEGTDAGASWNKSSGWEKLNRYISNGVTTSMADAAEIYRGTDEYIEKLNTEILPKYEKAISDLGSVVNEEFAFNEMVDSILEGKDIKQIGMLKSAIQMLNALDDPALSQIPELQNFARLLKDGRKGKFSYADLQSFINDPNNIAIKNAKDEKGNDISMQKASEAMQKNINNFLKISDKYNKLRKAVGGNSAFNVLSPLAQTQLTVQLVLKDVWQERLDSMQETLGTPTKKGLFSNLLGGKPRPNYEVEFGSVAGRERAENALERYINDNSKRLKIAEKRADFWKIAVENAETEEQKQQASQRYVTEAFICNYLSESIAADKEALKAMQSANVAFDEKGFVRTLSADEIMQLPPIQRAKMLNPDNLRDYSPEQQKVIKELTEALKNHVDANGETQDLYQMVLDAGAMQERLDASTASIRQVVKHPMMLQEYINRVQDRKAYLLQQATIEALKKEQLEKLAAVQTPEEAINVAFRGWYSEPTIDAGFYTPADTIKEYIEKHPERADLFEEAQKMVQTLEDFYSATDSVLSSSEAKTYKEIIARSVKMSNSAEDMISSIESLIDAQTDATAKLQFDRILEKMKDLGHQRDATKIRNRQLEREKAQEAEAKRLEEEAKKDGKNFGFDGYKVGDRVWLKKYNAEGTLTAFVKPDTAVIDVTFDDGTTGKYTITDKSDISKEKPVIEGPEGAIQTGEPEEVDLGADAVEEIKGKNGVTTSTSEEENPAVSPAQEQAPTEVKVEAGPDGKITSPTAEQQAAATKSPIQPIPEADVTEQGNIIPEDTPGLVSGNRWVTYSITALKDGIVREEIPDDPNSIYGKWYDWLKANNIKVQEIIDEEFGRIIAEKPDTKVQFMMMKQTETDNKLQRALINVIELTPTVKKYHDDSRGGVIQANGKSWLVVGITGFDSDATIQQNKAYETMRNPISLRRTDYFKSHPDEVYYVDGVAKTTVQNMTSGRIVNQRLGEEAARPKRVSELLKSAGMTLRQASFGIQTKEAGSSGFVVTKNVKDPTKVFPPRNVEDNRGRVFILLDTVNGYKIPGMIEPAMLNELEEDSPLRNFINQTIAGLFSTSYETRLKAAGELRNYLLLDEHKNILIGTKDSAVITIAREGFPNITQKLGNTFDPVKFLQDLENANFALNITIDTLENPVILDMYDKSNALVTGVDSMRTAGASYTLYMTDSNGKPIMNTPVHNAVPGTGTTAFKSYRSTMVNNTTYDFKNGQWVNRNTREKVVPGSSLEMSCYYTDLFRQGNISPFGTENGKALYTVVRDGNTIVVAIDGMNNAEEFSIERSKDIMQELQAKRDNKIRLENAEEVVFEDEAPAPTAQNPALGDITDEQLAQHIIGSEEAAAPPTQPQQTQREVKETKETESAKPKEVVDGVGTKSLTDLQNTKNLTTFEDIATSREFGDELYDILLEKKWPGVGEGEFADDIKILKEHNVPTTGITNVRAWLDLIKNCR